MSLRLLLLTLGLTAQLAGCGEAAVPSPTPTPVPPGTLLAHVGPATFAIEVADDATERAQGLSDRESLPADAGMWFTYVNAHQPSFWMRNMRFPIDIIWVDPNFSVVDITHEAPAPPEDAELSQLPMYTPNAPIQYVLEINAGLARALKIEPGAEVTLDQR